MIIEDKQLFGNLHICIAMQKLNYKRKKITKTWLFKIELKIVFLSDMIFIPSKKCFVTIKLFFSK